MSEELRLQYTEVNAKSRWYASQTWQVPFAYIALVGLMAGSFKDDNNLTTLGLALKVSAFLGIPIIIHLIAISIRIKDLVGDLNRIEEDLSLPSRSKNIVWIHGSVIIFFIVSLIIFYLAGCYFGQ